VFNVALLVWAVAISVLGRRGRRATV